MSEPIDAFWQNEDNFLLDADNLESKSECKWNYVDPRIKPCLVLTSDDMGCEYTLTIYQAL